MKVKIINYLLSKESNNNESYESCILFFGRKNVRNFLLFTFVFKCIKFFLFKFFFYFHIYDFFLPAHVNITKECFVTVCVSTINVCSWYNKMRQNQEDFWEMIFLLLLYLLTSLWHTYRPWILCLWVVFFLSFIYFSCLELALKCDEMRLMCVLFMYFRKKISTLS